MLLGELLVHRYQLITKEQRTQALARQSSSDRSRRLGEILIDMGLITRLQLREALDYQLEIRNPWRDAR
jgi:hypothetical protein